ncbi:hypothetical protein GCM10023144_04100 [Pigmentiphaga soli]|uniref:DUF1468 domain-containing protein n=1 Tax=Pigmentiphaga soli TaxID=1007095 RepID=A0ABP8GFX0_9BURK
MSAPARPPGRPRASVAKRLSAVALMALSLAIVCSAVQFGVYSDIGPGPGLFPMVLGALLCLLTVAWLTLPQSGDEGEAEPAPAGGPARAAAVAAIVLFAIVAMPLLGFALTAFAVAAAGMRAVGGQGWRATLAVAAAAGAGSAYLFQKLLEVPLPLSAIPGLRLLGV